MAANISFQPYSTTNVVGSFSVQSDGYVQGVALDDPQIRNSLVGGPLAATETLPMWGGVALQEYIPPSTANSSAGNTVARATTSAGVMGFSVLNQATAWITSPQSECPSAGSGMTIPYYRIGSGARIALAIDPALISLSGGLISQQVSWDFNAQRIAPYSSSGTPIAITSITSSYSATTGLYTFVVVAGAATDVGAVGDSITFAGVTGTGAAYVNTAQVVTSFTDNQHFSFQIAAANGAIATGALAGTITAVNPNGALPIKILKLNIGNSKVVQYDSINNLVHWANSGSTAIALI